jgi:hypothetical protein
LIAQLLLSLVAQQFVGGWTVSGPHSDAKEITAIERSIASNNAIASFKEHKATEFYGFFNVGDDLGSEAAASAFYRHKILSDEDKTLRVSMGSDDGIKVWLNGELLLDHQVNRATNPSEEHLLLPLKKGENLLSVCINNTGGTWTFAIASEKKANPITVDRAIRHGASYLISTQMLDGSWGFSKGSYRNGATALALYTLLSCGVSPKSAAVQKALSFISAAYPEKTYSASCQLMALAELNDPQYYDQMEAIVADLISWQERNGAWAYPAGSWDLSCSQFAILGLRSAAMVGIDVPSKVWADAISGILLCGAEFDGKDVPSITGFKYMPGYSAGGTLSMTAAAVASLEICRQQLGGRYPQKIRNKTLQAAKGGMAWIAQNFTVAQNFGWSGRQYYSIYGLERIGAVHEISHFGEHDWYNEGANFLVEAQTAEGGWPTTGASLPDTCYALLFLKRATASAAITGENEVSTGNEVVSERLDGRLILHVNNSDPVVMWTSLPDGTKTDSVSYAIKRGANAPWQAIGQASGHRFAYTHSFPSPGKWLVRAECKIEGQDVNSTETSYYYVPNLRPDDVGYGDDEFENLISISRPSITTSSANNENSFGGKQMLDGSHGTRWLTSGGDKNPEFTISMRRSAKATRLLFSHTYTSPKSMTGGAIPSEVEVYINNSKEPIVIKINPDQSQKTLYTFEKQTSIKKLRVVVTKIVNGTLGSAVIGFSQVELQS